MIKIKAKSGKVKDFVKLTRKRDEPAKPIEGAASAPRMDRVGYKRGGAVRKGKTVVNVNIGAQAAPPAPMMAPAGLMAAPPPGVVPPRPMPPMPPPGGPPMMPPPGAVPPGAMPPGGLAGPVALPARKHGGRVIGGAGGGLGRLRKAHHGC